MISMVLALQVRPLCPNFPLPFLSIHSGFYYVCVDFNPAATASAGGGVTADGAEDEDQHRSGRKQHRNRRGSSARRTGASSTVKRPPSSAPYSPPVATMSGFYYHQNSEPYVFPCTLCHGTDTYWFSAADTSSCL
jgi:hypothetical protein